jgi:hypothetical protein
MREDAENNGAGESVNHTTTWDAFETINWNLLRWLVGAAIIALPLGYVMKRYAPQSADFFASLAITFGAGALVVSAVPLGGHVVWRYRRTLPEPYRAFRVALGLDPVVLVIVSMTAIMTTSRSWNSTQWLHFVEFLPFFIIVLYRFSSKSRRARAIEELSRLPGWAVVAWALLLFGFILTIFGELTNALARSNWFSFEVEGHAVATNNWTVDRFYLWQLVHSVPTLELTDTFHLTEPLQYRSNLVAVLILVFKLAAVVPLIAVTTEWWRRRRLRRTQEPRSKQPERGLPHSSSPSER